MNSGQMLITLCAMALLSLVVLTVSRSFLSTNEVLINSKLDVLAVSLAASVIEEASSLAFDEATSAVNMKDLNSLTKVQNLGAENGELYGMFNDFDDYNNFAITDSTLPSAVFSIWCEVKYVDHLNPEQAAVKESWNKMLTVNVTSPSMSDTLSLSSVQSYWYFR